MQENITFDKPFKTYDELLDILSARNISISNREFARKVLAGLSYYKIINGYKNTFLSVPGTDSFVEGTKFEDLYNLHIIDSSLNSIVLKNILFVEQYLKTRIAYIVSQKYGVYTDTSDLSNTNSDDYLCRDYYSRSANGRNNILRQLKESLNSDRINDSVAHYANHHNHIPAWILVTNITFGLTLKWYNILKANDKECISSIFIPLDELSAEEKKEFFYIAMDLLREYRNKIAHGNRTFNISGLPVLPKRQLLTLSCGGTTEGEYNRGFGKNDLWSVILVCFILLDDKLILNNFSRDLKHLLDSYSSVPINNKSVFDIFNLPHDIFDRLQNIINQK